MADAQLRSTIIILSSAYFTLTSIARRTDFCFTYHSCVESAGNKNYVIIMLLTYMYIL